MRRVYKGFTLIEITLVMVLIAILIAITTPLVSSVIIRNDLVSAHESLYTTLLRAQQLSKNNYQNSQWRVCIDDTAKTYTITAGTCSSKLYPELIKISPGITVNSSQTLDIAFKAINGELDYNDNFIRVNLSGGGVSKSILITKDGIIDKAPPTVITPIVAATGGTETTIVENGTTYKVHTFTSNGTFNVTTEGTIEYLVVAGGGGGGAGYQGGGGGAGGFVSGSTSFINGSYDINIGNGGVGSGGSPATNGGNSSIGTIITANGGGRGASENPTAAANPGGSGGGGTHAGGLTGGSGSTGQGFAGGTGSSCSPCSGAGGGGAGGPGVNASSELTQPSGGAGLPSAISGTATIYAEGGSGAQRNANITSGSNGLANTGNGGNGGSSTSGSSTGGAGGSGIVIIRYPITQVIVPTTFAATGGTETTIVENETTYKVHTFTSNGIFNTTKEGTVEYLVVAGGGGGGGGYQGGGGGAGGFVSGTTSINGIHIINIGSGGVGARNTSGSNIALNGGNSSIGTIITATGGGRGASESPTAAANPGGSGGGGTHNGGLTGGAGITGQGFAGGTGSSCFPCSGAGGGGAGGPGVNASSGVTQPSGGVGLSLSISGISTIYAAGGSGAERGANITGTSGAINKGNGGNGGSNGSGTGIGGNGGSGIVIIRYPITTSNSTPTPTPTPPPSLAGRLILGPSSQTPTANFNNVGTANPVFITSSITGFTEAQAFSKTNVGTNGVVLFNWNGGSNQEWNPATHDKSQMASGYSYSKGTNSTWFTKRDGKYGEWMWTKTDTSTITGTGGGIVNTSGTSTDSININVPDTNVLHTLTIVITNIFAEDNRHKISILSNNITVTYDDSTARPGHAMYQFKFYGNIVLSLQNFNAANDRGSWARMQALFID